MKSITTSFITFLLILLTCQVFASVDGSENTTISWKEVGAGLSDNAMITGLTSTTDGKIFFGSAGEGTFVSTNNGDTWERRIMGGADIDNKVTTALYTHPSGKIYAGQSSGYVFVSQDNGNSFDTLCRIGSGIQGVVSFAADKENNVYFITSDGEFGIYGSDNTKVKTGRIDSLNTLAWSMTVDYQGNLLVGTMGEGIYLSTDKGDTWSKSNSGLPSLDVHKVVARDGILFAGLSETGGLYRSNDDGLTWKPSMNGMGSLVVMDIILCNNRRILFVATTKDVFKSEDYGQNWVSIKNDLPDLTNYRRLALDTDDYLYVGSLVGKIYRSQAPVKVDNGPLIINVEPSSDIYLEPGESKKIVITISDTENAPVENACVWVIDSVTQSHQSAYTDKYGKAQYNLYVDPGCTLGDFSVSFFAQESQYKNSDTVKRLVHVKMKGSWEKVQSYNLSKRVLSILTIGEDAILLGTAGAGLIVSANSGLAWHEANSGISNMNSIYEIVLDENGSILMATDWDGLLKSSDMGASWTKLNTGFEKVSNVAIGQEGSLFAFDSNGSMVKSDDDGATWQKPSGYPAGITKVNDVLSCPLGIFVAADTAGLYFSEDNGSTWQKLENGIEGIQATAINIFADSSLIIGSSNLGTFTSSDKGNEWQPANLNISDFNITKIVVDNDQAFATAFGKGVMYSANKGITWSEFNGGLEGLSFKDVFGLAASDDGYIYAGAFDKGLYKRKNPNPGTKGITEHNYSPIRMSISPNPVLNEFTISFECQAGGMTEISLYDLRGSKAATILCEYLDKGKHDFKWSANGLPNGAYFLEMRIGETTTYELIIIDK